MEGELRGLADELLQLLGVLQAGKLNEDAVCALAHDRRFRRAHVVDAAVDGFDRRCGGTGDALLQTLLGQLDDDRSRVRSFDDVDVVACRRREWRCRSAA